MNEIGKISFGMKDQSGEKQKVISTGAIISTMVQEKPGSYKAKNAVDEKLQMELLKYNYKSMAGKTKEELADFYEKMVAVPGKKAGEKEQRPRWMTLGKVPIHLVDMDLILVGRRCWPESYSAKSFCVSLHGIGEKGGKASRAMEDGTREDIICDPAKCPYAKGKVDGNGQCKNMIKLAVHLDLPGSNSGIGFYGISNSSSNSRFSLESQLETLKKLTCGFVSQIPLEIIQVRKTIKAFIAGKDTFITVPVLAIKPRMSHEEMIKLAYSHAAFVELANRARAGLEKIKQKFSFTQDDIDSFVNEYEEIESLEEELLDSEVEIDEE